MFIVIRKMSHSQLKTFIKQVRRYLHLQHIIHVGLYFSPRNEADAEFDNPSIIVKILTGNRIAQFALPSMPC